MTGAYKFPQPKFPMVHRHVVMYKLAQDIIINKWNVFLSGKQGCGKSFLAHSLGYFIKTHHVFTHGIYFITLRKMQSEMDLFSYLQTYFGKQFTQSNFYQFFDNKSMLLIFDDIDVIMKRYQWEQDARLLFRILKSYSKTIVNVFIYQSSGG